MIKYNFSFSIVTAQLNLNSTENKFGVTSQNTPHPARNKKTLKAIPKNIQKGDKQAVKTTI